MNLFKIHFILFFLLIKLICPLQVNSQSNNQITKDRDKYQLPLKKFKGYSTADLSTELITMGIQHNPGVTNDDYMKSISCIECNISAIQDVYVHIIANKSESINQIGVIVKSYASEVDLNKDIAEQLKISDNTIYLKKANDLIILFSDEEEEDDLNKQLEILQQHYVKMGAQPINLGDLIVSEFSDIDFSDTSYVKEVNVLSNENKKLKYLFGTPDGFIAFYDDGTVSLCGECVLCENTLEELKTSTPFSIYQVHENRIMLHAPDVDISEPLILEIHDNSEIQEWYIVDYKGILPIPKNCE